MVYFVEQGRVGSRFTKLRKFSKLTLSGLALATEFLLLLGLLL